MPQLPQLNFMISSKIIIAATSAKKAGMIAHEIFKDFGYEYLKVSLGAPSRYVAWERSDFDDMTGEE